MISGIDLKATIDYTCKDDTEDPTIWKLGIIPSVLLVKIMQDGSKAPERQLESAIMALRLGLKGWDKYNCEYATVKEKLYGYEVDMLPIDIINTLPPQVMLELSTKILEINSLTADERKN